MAEKRDSERVQLLEFQQVEDAENGKIIGYLGDISHKGIRVLRKAPFPMGEHHRVKLKYVFVGGETQSLECDVEGV